MKIEVKTPSYLPVIPQDIVEAYAVSLSEYTCEKQNECDSVKLDCFCGFVEKLQRFDMPVMGKENFYAYTNATDMTEEQSEELYENYVYNWSSKQTLAERVEVMNQITSSKGDEMYEFCLLSQEMAKDFKSRAESILAS